MSCPVVDDTVVNVNCVDETVGTGVESKSTNTIAWLVGDTEALTTTPLVAVTVAEVRGVSNNAWRQLDPV